MHEYHEGSGSAKFSTWLKRSSPPGHGKTWDLDSDGFLLRVFSLDFFVNGDWSLRTGPLPPLEWTSIPPLVTAVLITPKGADSLLSHQAVVVLE